MYSLVYTRGSEKRASDAVRMPMISRIVMPANMCLRNTSKTAVIASDFFKERKEVLCEISEMAVLIDMVCLFLLK
jgi:hypothetical protein